MHLDRRLVITLLGLALIAPPLAADPPPWAPAHGYRNKHQGEHHGHEHAGYHQEGGSSGRFLSGGRCNREELGMVLGGAAGGALGSTVGKGDGKTVAAVAGGVIGMLIGGSIGRSMDEADQHCVGQALEYAGDRQPVRWRDPDSGEYVVTPQRSWRDDGRYCREYTTGYAGREESRVACRNADGEWLAVN
jgi:surface antigen